MKISLQIPRYHWEGSPANLGEKLRAIARTADEQGFSSIWVMDHLFQMDGFENWKASDLMLEAYSALNFMAAVTSKVRLGALVTAATYRDPGLLMKTVTALDVLSGGRAYLGIGAGWYEREAHGLGLDFPPLAERFERLEETLQIAMKMWAGDSTPFEGKHYHLKEPINKPQALSKPRPPILIGGSGEKKTLRMVAQYADACNFFGREGTTPVVRKLELLKSHCDKLGRDYNTIDKTVLYTISTEKLDVKAVLDLCKDFAGIGIQHMILSDVPNIQEITPLEQIGRDVIPEVSGLGA
jgi:F420-dependent oxidoreductase-like protein